MTCAIAALLRCCVKIQTLCLFIKGKKIKNKIFIKYLEYEIMKYIYFKDIAKKPSFMHEIT